MSDPAEMLQSLQAANERLKKTNALISAELGALDGINLALVEDNDALQKTVTELKQTVADLEAKNAANATTAAETKPKPKPRKRKAPEQ